MQKALLTVTDVKAFISDAISRGGFVNKKTVAEYLNVSTETIARYMRQGMPWVGIKHRPKFILSDVNEWLIRKGKKNPL